MSTAEWTLMVYLAANNSLSPNAFADIDELRRVGSTEAVNVVVMHDSLYEAPSRYRVEQGGAGEQAESLPDLDTGDGATIVDFVRWAVERWPARGYALILWSHGSGWDQAEMVNIARAAAPPDFDIAETAQRGESPLRRVFFRSSLRRIAELPTRSQRAVCVDDGSGHSLDTVELGRVMAQIALHLGRPLDLLGMDACLMANLEVVYEIRSSVRALVASEAPEPDSGWPYEPVLTLFNAAPASEPIALAAGIVRAFGVEADRKRDKRASTLVAVDPARVDALATDIDALAEALLAGMPAARQTLWAAHAKTSRFWGDTLADLSQLCDRLSAKTSPPQKAAAALRAELAPGGAISASFARGKDVAGVGGLSIYLPVPRKTPISKFYAATAFARERRWAALIGAYVGEA
ncbi:MAG TPA: clostripain-related cysteine peptidase [Thermoflexales bacterium]|nr:clostripain-related cysteine peptidase [Thermoflexales bacterium]HQZ52821.1 clostripain-related cysteine peptidase [Thermoflexales bacterium]